ncbi:ABC-type amino acid transport substrate-binding protein [Rheinheimera pacifica]|uniref:substrate-binding periplasmic protein n=1 Tax=Rheinheimera pacifica TaxID=173990 RepID=UPI002169006E|nr:transporter substrate-binding domain-containing protein [Rheinheimera pacifica]MCS4308240.1 ABC-type amino acid transport substrate-binding protein [Rheinheimera pacifica]
MTPARPLCLTVTIMLASWLAATAVQAEEPLPGESEPQLLWCLDHFSRFHHYEDVTIPYGPSVDLMQELARRAGFKLAFTPKTPVARCLRLMAEGKVDLMSNLKFSAERDAIMYLLPYNKTVPESLFIRQDDKRQLETEAQLQQLTLVSIRGYIYSPAITALLQQKQRHIVEVDSIEAGLEMVIRGRVDGLVAPTVSTSEAIDNISSYHNKFRNAGIDFSRGQSGFIHIGLSRLSPYAAMEPILRQHLATMLNDGTVERLYAIPTKLQPAPRLNKQP